MYIETHLTPRFSDTDAMGHINNTAVTQWLEAGRLDFYMNHLRRTHQKCYDALKLITSGK